MPRMLYRKPQGAALPGFSIIRVRVRVVPGGYFYHSGWFDPLYFHGFHGRHFLLFGCSLVRFFRGLSFSRGGRRFPRSYWEAGSSRRGESVAFERLMPGSPAPPAILRVFVFLLLLHRNSFQGRFQADPGFSSGSRGVFSLFHPLLGGAGVPPLLFLFLLWILGSHWWYPHCFSGDPQGLFLFHLQGRLVRGL